MTFDLTGETALVTGASGGLGRHFAGVLARAGARVALAARRRTETERAAAELVANGFAAIPIALDVTDAASVASAFAEVAERLGPVNLLVNNSGVTAPGAAIALEEADWDRVLDTNLKGAWLCAREMARRLIAAGREGAPDAVIINVASIAGLRVAGEMSAYASSKAALIQLTKAMALELARHRIRVNALAPGYVLTDFNRAFFESAAGQTMIKRIPQRRLGNPDDLDGPLLLLASPAGRHMTGSVLVVDGGHSVSSL